MGLDTEKYLKKVAEKTKPKDEGSGKVTHANRMSISGDSMRGDITLLPFCPDAFNGEPYLTIGGKKDVVREVNIKTSQTKKGNGWALILPKRFYGQLSANEEALYDEVVAIWEKVAKHMPDNSSKWKYIRSKKYTILAGILLEHNNLQGEEITEHKGKPTFFLYPTIMLAKEIDEMLQVKMKMAKGDPSVITDLFNNNTVGRDCALMINIRKKSDSDGIGYEIKADIRSNDKYNKIVDPEKDYGEGGALELLTDPIESLLMWGYDHENGRPFSITTFSEIRNSLSQKLKSMNLEEETPAGMPETKVESTKGETKESSGEPIVESKEAEDPNTPF